ncbi:hypothetical protein OPQ81_007962 [Rhizoctonia solani]|nr:hypothetical protein OPQ81_007962 [Rhizoctonia solani]
MYPGLPSGYLGTELAGPTRLIGTGPNRSSMVSGKTNSMRTRFAIGHPVVLYPLHIPVRTLAHFVLSEVPENHKPTPDPNAHLISFYVDKDGRTDYIDLGHPQNEPAHLAHQSLLCRPSAAVSVVRTERISLTMCIEDECTNVRDAPDGSI